MNPSDKGSEKKNTDRLYKEARREIRASARESRRRLQSEHRMDDIEEKLKRLQAERQRQRREQRKRREQRPQRRRSEMRQGPAPAGDTVTAYSVLAYLQQRGSRRQYREGFVRRALRLIKTLAKLRKRLRSDDLISAEKKRRAYEEVFLDCCEPIAAAADDALETAWGFLCAFGRDTRDMVLYVCDMVIVGLYYLVSVLRFFWDLFWDLRLWMEQRKRALFQAFAVMVCCGVMGAVFISSLVGYEYSYYGKALGIARSRDDVYKTIDILGDKLAEATGANVSLDVERDIDFRRLIGFHLKIDSPDDILDTLTYMKDIQVHAYAILIDGVETVYLEDAESAEKLLDIIRADYKVNRSDTKITDVKFVQDVQVAEAAVQLGDIWNMASARRYLEKGTAETLVRSTDRPKLDVQTTELFTYYENIGYGTAYIDNADLYVDETELVSEGKPGRQENVARIVRRNGEETSRELVSSNRIAEPVSEVFYKGTKPIPPKTGTGTFKYPITNYRISSRFGMRWGRMHNGVDFAAPVGTKLFATDGGVVTYAGWKNSFGNIVIIDHGGFYESYYAHCSKLLVKEGDRVYQGENIALCGSTGNSTGPHLHFEIRYKGQSYNPLNYLK